MQGCIGCANETRCIRSQVESALIPGQPDVIPLASLTAAANIALKYPFPSQTATGVSRRRSGCSLMVTIEYNNKPPWSDLALFRPNYVYEPAYTYTVREIPDTRYKVDEILPINATHRKRRARHGVKLSFVQTGEIYRWSLRVAFIQFMSVVGVLGLTTLVIEKVIFRIKPEYEEEKFRVVAPDIVLQPSHVRLPYLRRDGTILTLYPEEGSSGRVREEDDDWYDPPAFAPPPPLLRRDTVLNVSNSDIGNSQNDSQVWPGDDAPIAQMMIPLTAMGPTRSVTFDLSDAKH